jgi:hypothetical protein
MKAKAKTKAQAIVMAAAALFLLSGQAARADDECDDVMEFVDDSTILAANTYQLQMEDISTKKPETDAEKNAFRNKFCALTGEFLGRGRANAALISVCRTGDKRRRELAQINEAIKKLESAIAEACN